MNAIFFNYNDFSDILQNSGNFVALFLVGFVLLDADRSRDALFETYFSVWWGVCSDEKILRIWLGFVF
jgi:hypothetical protein